MRAADRLLNVGVKRCFGSPRAAGQARQGLKLAEAGGTPLLSLGERRLRMQWRSIARRAGIKLAPGEAPGPLDLADRSVREAVRDLFAERFGYGLSPGGVALVGRV